MGFGMLQLPTIVKARKRTAAAHAHAACERFGLDKDYAWSMLYNALYAYRGNYQGQLFEDWLQAKVNEVKRIKNLI